MCQGAVRRWNTALLGWLAAGEDNRFRKEREGLIFSLHFRSKEFTSVQRPWAVCLSSSPVDLGHKGRWFLFCSAGRSPSISFESLERVKLLYWDWFKLNCAVPQAILTEHKAGPFHVHDAKSTLQGREAAAGQGTGREVGTVHAAQRGLLLLVACCAYQQGSGQTCLAAEHPFGVWTLQVHKLLAPSKGPHHGVWEQAPCLHSQEAEHSSCSPQLSARAEIFSILLNSLARLGDQTLLLIQWWQPSPLFSRKLHHSFPKKRSARICYFTTGLTAIHQLWQQHRCFVLWTQVSDNATPSWQSSRFMPWVHQHLTKGGVNWKSVYFQKNVNSYCPK